MRCAILMMMLFLLNLAVAFLGKVDGNAVLPKQVKYAIRLPAQRWMNDRTYPFFQDKRPREDRLVTNSNT